MNKEPTQVMTLKNLCERYFVLTRGLGVRICYMKSKLGAKFYESIGFSRCAR
jgi:hypothetical protein